MCDQKLSMIAKTETFHSYTKTNLNHDRKETPSPPKQPPTFYSTLPYIQSTSRTKQCYSHHSSVHFSCCSSSPFSYAIILVAAPHAMFQWLLLRPLFQWLLFRLALQWPCLRLSLQWPHLMTSFQWLLLMHCFGCRFSCCCFIGRISFVFVPVATSHEVQVGLSIFVLDSIHQ